MHRRARRDPPVRGWDSRSAGGWSPSRLGGAANRDAWECSPRIYIVAAVAFLSMTVGCKRAINFAPFGHLTVISTFGHDQGESVGAALHLEAEINPSNLLPVPTSGTLRFYSELHGLTNCVVLAPHPDSDGDLMLDEMDLPESVRSAWADAELCVCNFEYDAGATGPFREAILVLAERAIETWGKVSSAGLQADAEKLTDEFLFGDGMTGIDVWAPPDPAPHSVIGPLADELAQITAFARSSNGTRFLNPEPLLAQVYSVSTGNVTIEAPTFDAFVVRSTPLREYGGPMWHWYDIDASDTVTGPILDRRLGISVVLASSSGDPVTPWRVRCDITSTNSFEPASTQYCLSDYWVPDTEGIADARKRFRRILYHTSPTGTEPLTLLAPQHVDSGDYRSLYEVLPAWHFLLAGQRMLDVGVSSAFDPDNVFHKTLTLHIESPPCVRAGGWFDVPRFESHSGHPHGFDEAWWGGALSEPSEHGVESPNHDLLDVWPLDFISLAENEPGNVMVHVDATDGPYLAESSNIEVFDVIFAPLTAPTTEVALIAKNPDGAKNGAWLQLRRLSDDRICGSAWVAVYERKSVAASYYRVSDPTHDTGDPFTNPTNPPVNAEIVTLEDGMNAILKLGVVDVTLTGDTDKKIAYDTNGNHALDVYRGAVDLGPEMQALAAEIAGTASSPSFAHVSRLVYHILLDAPAAAGDKHLTLKTTHSLLQGDVLTLEAVTSPPGSSEEVTIARTPEVGSKVVELTAPIQFSYEASAKSTVHKTLAGLSSNPLIVAGATQTALVTTLVHEMLHAPGLGGLSDVPDTYTDNVMSGNHGTVLRFRRVKGRYPPHATERQWEAIKRGP